MEDGYKLFDPKTATVSEIGLLDKLKERDRQKPIMVRGLTLFSMALHEGFERITYQAETMASGAFYWITEAHGRMIGNALDRNLKAFGLTFTTFQDNALKILVDEIQDGIIIDEVTFAHKSADEVKISEAVELARMLTKVRAQIVHLWAGEFDPGSLEAMADELLRLENKTLKAYDICDVTRPEPEDKISVPKLDAFLKR